MSVPDFRRLVAKEWRKSVRGGVGQAQFLAGEHQQALQGVDRHGRGGGAHARGGAVRLAGPASRVG